MKTQKLQRSLLHSIFLWWSVSKFCCKNRNMMILESCICGQMDHADIVLIKWWCGITPILVYQIELSPLERDSWLKWKRKSTNQVDENRCFYGEPIQYEGQGQMKYMYLISMFSPWMLLTLFRIFLYLCRNRLVWFSTCTSMVFYGDVGPKPRSGFFYLKMEFW